MTVADCCRGEGRGEDREIAGVKHADVVTARLVQDERGWLRLAGSKKEERRSPVGPGSDPGLRGHLGGIAIEVIEDLLELLKTGAA
jgi:hypothetical protein